MCSICTEYSTEYSTEYEVVYLCMCHVRQSGFRSHATRDCPWIAFWSWPRPTTSHLSSQTSPTHLPVDLVHPLSFFLPLSVRRLPPCSQPWTFSRSASPESAPQHSIASIHTYIHTKLSTAFPPPSTLACLCLHKPPCPRILTDP